MSRGKTRRRRARTVAAARRAPPATAVEAASDASGPAQTGENRVRSARRRARFAKAVLCTGGAAVFAGAMLLARTSFPGHAKAPTTPLNAPPKFVKIVRKNLLQAGIVAAPQAPPDATTSVS